MSNEEISVKYVENLHQATSYYKRMWKVVEITDQYTLLRQNENSLVRLLPCPKHLTHIYKECPCLRCHKFFPDHELKYDDDYLEEEVCKLCAGFRKCELCNRLCDVKKLVLNKDNYLVCSMCNEHEISRCDKCRHHFYAFELNYYPNNVYFCDVCENVHNEENDMMEYEEYD